MAHGVAGGRRRGRGAGWYFAGVTRAQAAVRGLAHEREQSRTWPRVPLDKWLGCLLRQGSSG